MNKVIMNLLYMLLVIFCLNAKAETNKEARKNEVSKKFTADDLIQGLLKLAAQNTVPRQNFYQNFQNRPISDEPQFQRPNLYDGYPQYPLNPYPYKKKPSKYRYPSYLQDESGLAYPQDQGGFPPNLKPSKYRYPPYLQDESGFPLNPKPSRYPPYYQDQGGFPYPQDQGFLPNRDPYLQPGFPPFQDPNGFPPGPFPYQENPLESFARALSSIARYDDQQCVPRLLCEVAAGGNPSGKQNNFLPSFLSMDSLFTLLSAFANEQVSPFLIFGRAAILGITSRGNPSSCRYAYPECPRDPDRLVDYLNNHNGGFFRFFSGNPQDPGFDFPQGQDDQYGDGQNDQQYGQNYPQYQYPDNYNDRPQNYNDRPQNYNDRPQNYNDRPQKYQDYNRPQSSSMRFPYRYESRFLKDNATASIEERIQNKPSFYSNQDFNTPQKYYQNTKDSAWRFPEASSNYPVYVQNSNFIQSDFNSNTGLKFPQDEHNYRKTKYLTFPEQNLRENELIQYPKPLPFYDHTKMIFPDRTGTGNLKFDSEKLQRPIYRPDIENFQESHYVNYGNYHRPTRHYNDHPQSSSSGTKYVYIVRGNGDPNHPEKVPIEYARSAKSNNGDLEAEESSTSTNRRDGKSWAFPPNNFELI